MTNSQAPGDKLIHAVLIVEKIVRHVPSFLKVAGGGQTHPKNFDNQGKKPPSQNLDNPDPLSGGGGLYLLLQFHCSFISYTLIF